jgi:DNA-binding transcriptional LysR family regulator
LDIRHLNCFVAVAEYQSFTEAAKTLHLVQSAVSHNIAELENELGAKLFTRGKKGICLTPQGKILLEDAYHILAMERDAAMRVRRQSSGVVGELSMGYVFVPLINSLIDDFKRFHERYPQVYVKYNSYNDIQIFRQLEHNELDIGFTRDTVITNREKVDWYHIYDDTLKIVASKNHPLAQLKKAKLEQFRNDPLILMSHRSNPGLYDMSMHLYITDGFMPQIIDDINDERTVNMLVEIGIGVTILPTSWKDHVSQDLTFIDIESDETVYHFGVACNKENTNPCTKLFLSELGIL